MHPFNKVMEEITLNRSQASSKSGTNSEKSTSSLSPTSNARPPLKKEPQKWEPKAEAGLSETFVFLAEMQKTYGKTVNLPAVIAGFKFAFEGKYTPEQVQYALKVHLQNTQEFPTPAHITAILNPPKPRVSYAEYIAALEWQKRNQDWSQFSSAADTIRDYRLASQNDQHAYERQQEEIALIAKAAPLLLEDSSDD
jgi:hypothetical protein